MLAFFLFLKRALPDSIDTQFGHQGEVHIDFERNQFGLYKLYQGRNKLVIFVDKDILCLLYKLNQNS